MQHILIGSPDKDAVSTISKGLSPDFLVEIATDSNFTGSIKPTIISANKAIISLLLI